MLESEEITVLNNNFVNNQKRSTEKVITCFDGIFETTIITGCCIRYCLLYGKVQKICPIHGSWSGVLCSNRLSNVEIGL